MVEQHERVNSRVYEGRNMVECDANSPILISLTSNTIEGKGWYFCIVDGNIRVSCIEEEINWWKDSNQVKAKFLELDPTNETHNNAMWDKYGQLIIQWAEA